MLANWLLPWGTSYEAACSAGYPEWLPDSELLPGSAAWRGLSGRAVSPGTEPNGRLPNSAESARDSSLVSTVVEILTITVFGDPEKKRDSHDNCFW